MASTRIILIFSAATSLAQAAAAQDRTGAVDQIAAGPAEPIEQISTGSRQIVSPVRTEAQIQTSVTPQLSTGRDSTPPPAQLTSEPRTAGGASQLYTGGRTAEPSEALSRPSEGRTGAVNPVQGKDRCDPEEPDQARNRVCAAVIETRAAEFNRPEPAELSPEHKLMIEQRSRSATFRDATRRLGEGGFDPNSIEAQGIASVAMEQNAPSGATSSGPTAPTEGLSDPARAVVDAIVAAFASQAAPPPQ